MERNTVKIICIVIASTFLAGMVYGTMYQGIEDVKNESLDDNYADISPWKIGSYWSYQQDFWYNSTDDWIYLEEEFTYTVSEIEFVEYEGSEHMCYNLTLEGDIVDGEGEFDGHELEIEGGTIDGYLVRRVSDLGVVEDRQERYFYGVADGYVDVDVWFDFTRNDIPVVEDYDFPLSTGNKFWGHTTMITDGYYAYDAGIIGEDEEYFYEEEDSDQVTNIAPEMVDVNTPEGTFTTFHLDHHAESDDSTGYVDQWYAPDVDYAVQEDSYMETEDGETLEWFRQLDGYELNPVDTSISVEPDEAKVCDNVTVSGIFPDHPNTELNVFIDDLIMGDGEWTVMTDGDGMFELEFMVPLVKDNTPTNYDLSTSGIVAYVSDSPDINSVTTLTVLTETHDIELDEGWNFVSTILDTSILNVSLEDILDHSSYGISGSYDRVVYYNASADRWVSYKPGRTEHFNTLENFDYTMGLWILMNQVDTLTIEGVALPEREITLYPGWNMVSYPCSTAGNNDLPTEITKIGYFNASEEYNLAYDYEPEEFDFELGDGYWVYNSADHEVDWTIDF